MVGGADIALYVCATGVWLGLLRGADIKTDVGATRETPVIPAKAGIQPVDSAFPRVGGVDSRFRGNDCDLQPRVSQMTPVVRVVCKAHRMFHDRGN